MAAGLAGCGGSGSGNPSSVAAAGNAETEAGGSKAAAPAGIALDKFVKDVAEKSGGSINISLFTDGTLGSAADNYSSVASGDLDMAMTGLEGLDLYAPEYTFLDSPFLIESWGYMDALLDSGIGDNLKARYEENGFVTLGWHHRDIEHVYEFVGLFINKELYDSMSENQKKILNDCAAENLEYADKLSDERREEYKKECLEGGMILVDVDRAAFREALSDFYKEQFEDKWTVTTYDEVMSYAK